MKKFFFALYFILAIPQLSIFSQGCLPGETFFTSQSDIDNFQTNYPGCSMIEGKLRIDGDNITNLYGLSVLTSIYHLELYNIDLTNLTGLNNVTYISYLEISRCNSLESLNGLENLLSLDRGLNISYNTNLKNLEGLSNLTSVGNLFNIRYTSLTNLMGLNSLTTVEYFSIYKNDSLINLDGLESLSHIASSIEIGNNKSLLDISGLENVSYIRTISVNGNDNIISLEGLDDVDPATLEYLYLKNNSSLTTCEVQSVCDFLLSSSGTASINNNATGCNSQQEVEDACEYASQLCLPEGIVFSSQSEIDEFKSNYPNCIEIEGDVLIEGDDITNLTGLDSIYFIQGNLEIAHNPLLKNLTGLNNLNFIGENLEIWGNDSLINLIGLNGLISVDNTFKISGNLQLMNLSGIESLISIGEDVEIAYDENLINLQGLSNLTSIWGDLRIVGNFKLTSIEGITNINSETIKGLYIYENSSLQNCDVESICNYLTSPNGIIEINNNLENCNSKEEVYGLCTEWIYSHSDHSNFLIYPNPATKKINISNKLNIKIEEIRIINSLGQLVLTQKRNIDIVDISNIKEGLYILELYYGNNKYRNKIVISK